MPQAWSPSRVPDIYDAIPGALPPSPGATIAPSGIASAEAFGAATVSTGSGVFLPGYLEYLSWESSVYLADTTRQMFAYNTL